MELKSLKELTEEEKIEFAKSEWNEPGMQSWLIKNYDFYKTVDGYVIEIDKPSKLSLTNELWYDDEYDAPEINFKNFVEENSHNCNRHEYYLDKANRQYNKFYFVNNGSLKNVCVMIYDNWELNERPHPEILRELTEDEKQDILELYKIQKEGYIKRLERYWNRYKNNIRTHGYWANR